MTASHPVFKPVTLPDFQNGNDIAIANPCISFSSFSNEIASSIVAWAGAVSPLCHLTRASKQRQATPGTSTSSAGDRTTLCWLPDFLLLSRCPFFFHGRASLFHREKIPATLPTGSFLDH